MKSSVKKKQKITEIRFNAADDTAEVYTYDTDLKKRLRQYAAKYPKLCRQTGDDKQGGLRFEIDKHRISIRLTAPYSQERRDAASRFAAQGKQQNHLKEDILWNSTSTTSRTACTMSWWVTTTSPA